MKNLFRNFKDKYKNDRTQSAVLPQLPRTYMVHQTPPEYNGRENLTAGIWLTKTERYAPEEWFDLWAKAGWVPWTRNSDPEEDGIIYPFIRFDHYETVQQTYTLHDPNPKDIDDYSRIEISHESEI